MSEFDQATYDEARKSEPKRPVGDREIEVHVVARRCVYVNNHRIAGSKPYISENLPSHTLKTRLRDVLASFNENDVLAALEENRAWQDHWRKFRNPPEEPNP